MDNYPPGAANDPRAPYNQPDGDPALDWATEQVTGSDLDLTAETFTEYLCNVAPGRVAPLVATPVLTGPVGMDDLLKLLLQPGAPDAMVLAAVHELRARYLADAYTRRVIESQAERAIEFGTSRREALAEAAERWRDAA